MGVVQPDAIRELGKLLAIVSAEAAKAYAGNFVFTLYNMKICKHLELIIPNHFMIPESELKAHDGVSAENGTLIKKEGLGSVTDIADEVQNHSQISATAEVKEENLVEGEVRETTLMGPKAPQTYINATESESGTDGSRQRPMSPGTLALMCDEQDSLFTAPPSPSGSNTGVFPTQKSPIISQMHAEQEKAILSEFRDCLMRIVSVGNKRGILYIILFPPQVPPYS